MFKIKEVDAKTTPRKKNLELKNISVKDLKLIDTDTGEDITEEVIKEILNEDGESIESAPHPQQKLRIRFDRNPGKDFILRKKK